MSIQVNQVRGDLVELVFNPREEDLRVGETLRIEERDSGEGLVVQIIAFRMVTYPSLIQEQLQLAVGQAPAISPEILTYLSETKESLEDLEANEVRNLKIAISKIRKLTGRAGANGELDSHSRYGPVRTTLRQRCGGFRQPVTLAIPPWPCI